MQVHLVEPHGDKAFVSRKDIFLIIFQFVVDKYPHLGYSEDTK